MALSLSQRRTRASVLARTDIGKTEKGRILGRAGLGGLPAGPVPTLPVVTGIPTVAEVVTDMAEYPSEEQQALIDIALGMSGATAEESSSAFRQLTQQGIEARDDMVTNGVSDIPQGIPIGADLRDFAGGLEGSNGVSEAAVGGVIVLSRLLPLVPVLLRGRVLAWASSAGIGQRVGWAALPGWLKTILTGAGFTGLALVVDGITDIEQLPNLLEFGDGAGAGDHVMHGAAVVGSWVANGVTFYRLADGKLAVQNKLGRWKVWKPKRPIVLYAGGAINLKTMLRADKVLNKQAKQIASMLNRRAPRPRRPSRPDQSVIVAAHSVPVAQLTAGR